MIWLLLGIILVTIVLNRLSLKYGFLKLDYNMEVEKTVVEIGEDLTIITLIENPKLLSVPFLMVNEKFPLGFSEEDNSYSVFLMPYQRIIRRYSIKALKRGLHRFADINLDIGDFIGFDSDKKTIKTNKKVTVLPEKIDLKNSIVPVGDLYGDISVKRWIVDDPLMTVGLREYTSNDPQKYIHWPSSMRYGELMVKKFDFTTDRSAIVLLNVESSKPYWKNIEGDLIEEAIKICRATIEELENLKIPYGFATNAYNVNSDYNMEHYYHPGLGKAQCQRFIEILGNINYAVSSTLEDTLGNISRRKGSYSTVIVITPTILDSYVEPLNNLSKVISKTVAISIEDKNLNKLNSNIYKYRGDTND